MTEHLFAIPSMNCGIKFIFCLKRISKYIQNDLFNSIKAKHEKYKYINVKCSFIGYTLIYVSLNPEKIPKGIFIRKRKG